MLSAKIGNQFHQEKYVDTVVEIKGVDKNYTAIQVFASQLILIFLIQRRLFVKFSSIIITVFVILISIPSYLVSLNVWFRVLLSNMN